MTNLTYNYTAMRVGDRLSGLRLDDRRADKQPTVAR